MSIPSQSIGTISGLRNYTTESLIANFDCGSDYSFSGNTASDLLSNGVLYSTPGGYVSLVRGSTAAPAYIDLDGATDYLIASSSPAIFNTLSTLTVVSWIRPAVVSAINQTIASTNGINALSAQKGWTFQLRNTGVMGYFYNTGTDAEAVASTNTYSANVWTFVALMLNGTDNSVRFRNYYSNGTTADQTLTGQVVSTSITTQNVLAIGRRSIADNPQFFNGDISLVRVYNRILSTTELDFDYQRSKKRYGH